MQIYKYISDFTSFLKFFFLFDFCFERFFLSFAKILLRFCFSQNGYKQALRLPFSIGFCPKLSHLGQLGTRNKRFIKDVCVNLCIETKKQKGNEDYNSDVHSVLGGIRLMYDGKRTATWRACWLACLQG